ncbi:hypothetical protein H7J73_12330 [Mycolicibacterium komossense]|uniref:Diacylglycerol O-acyltransferase n=1 Tax=Mycolicibacterium komossense TaxID=1779 RepID=A0ABT3CBF1_9MYCO|nr:hypothetical protein [Mycolicibacterium komossense]
MRATGEEAVMQCAWLYEHPVDLEGLRRFHRNFGYGLAGRRIEPSPLPFGRHRWVSSLGPPVGIDFVEHPRPREELSDWLDERAQLPIDPQWGPAWHLGVLPLTDGSTAVTMVGSHCIGDGGGAFLTVFEAVNGVNRDLGYPPPLSRTRSRAILTDARETVQGLPEVARTVAEAVRQARKRKRDSASSGAPAPRDVAGRHDDELVVAPAITVFVDAAEWDARAAALGGNSYALSAGFAAKLAQRIGRVRAVDGMVTLNVPINDRTLEDTRANAVTLGDITVDPTNVTSDLTALRLAIRESLKARKDSPDEALKLLPLIPFLPKRAVRKTADAMFNFADLPVSCSNLGELPADIGRADGTDAEFVYVRGVDGAVTRGFLEARRGLLTVISARVNGRLSLAIIAYRPGAENTKPELRELAAKVLAEFELTGIID